MLVDTLGQLPPDMRVRTQFEASVSERVAIARAIDHLHILALEYPMTRVSDQSYTLKS